MTSALSAHEKETACWASVAEPQLCVMEALTEQLTRVNHLLETSFNDLSSQFVQMAEDFRHYREGAQADTEEAQALGKRIEQTLAQSIMSMQFQDRVSQNLVITMDVLRALATELESELAAADSPAEINYQAARELYHFLRLGEIRQEYLASMTRRGFIQKPEDLGIATADAPQGADEEDIELF